MSFLLVHLSDAHISAAGNAILKRSELLTRAIVAELDGTIECCLVAFTGDATDRGKAAGFPHAAAFLRSVVDGIRAARDLPIELLVVPGNHDLVMDGDQSIREMSIGKLSEKELTIRPTGRIEEEILSPLKPYFDFAKGVTGSPVHAADCPYYVQHEVTCGGRKVRFHLINSSWMCNAGQALGSLGFPLEEIRPAHADQPPEYEVTLLHHPFHWFRQPDVMRPLRDVVEGMSDLILTGHEHVGRAQHVVTHGVADHEYLEGEALQEGQNPVESAFRLMRLDFAKSTQVVSGYRWSGSHDSFIRHVGPTESPLGRNRRRATRAFRLLKSWEEWLDDAELPILHNKKGKLRLSDFYTYPDLKRMNEDDGEKDVPRRVKGESLVDAIAKKNRSFIYGSDRCGKTSFAKRLYVDLHAKGKLPLLLDATRLRNQTVEKIARLIETLVKDQYEALAPENYTQQALGLRVLIVDDFQNGPKDKAKRSLLLKELERHFGNVVLLASEDYFLEDVVSVGEEERAKNPTWGYEHYRLLPFGFLRCSEFVRRWVGLEGGSDTDLIKTKLKQIDSLLQQFLRSNPIPHHPWVVMVIVQQADSPEPAAAESGSYGYLLQALINVALAKSTLELPVGGKYRWLGELAHQLYRRNRASLSDVEARAFHEEHKKTFGPRRLEYSKIVEDLEGAGVLRNTAGEISFRQSYTFCYFVAWHLAQRINENDPSATKDVERLCTDLYHEDTANVLVFLAHLTSSRVVLDAMKGRAAGLFKDIRETDLDKDVEFLNDLHPRVEELVLKDGSPEEHKKLLEDQQDEARAATEGAVERKGSMVLHPNDVNNKPPSHMERKIMEITATMRTIEILGQVLRNEATGRKIPEMVAIADEIFRVGRRLMGFLFTNVADNLKPLVGSLTSVYRSQMPEAPQGDVAKEVSRYVFNLNLFVAFAVVQHVATAVGEPNLEDVFAKIMEGDPSLPNELYKLAIDLEIAEEQLPTTEISELFNRLKQGKKVPNRDLPYRNYFAQTLVRHLVVDHLLLNHVPYQQRQTACKAIGIDEPGKTLDPTQKKLAK